MVNSFMSWSRPGSLDAVGPSVAVFQSHVANYNSIHQSWDATDADICSEFQQAFIARVPFKVNALRSNQKREGPKSGN
jgi:hypothetical protein